MVGTLHFAAAIVALISGVLVTFRQKGTRWHMWSGRAYVGSMAIMLLTAMMIYDLFGGFGPFHYLANFSALTLIAGMIPVYRKRPRKRWIINHATLMGWSYIGLWAAAAAETTTRLLDLDFGPTAIVTSALVVLVGCG